MKVAVDSEMVTAANDEIGRLRDVAELYRGCLDAIEERLALFHQDERIAAAAVGIVRMERELLIRRLNTRATESMRRLAQERQLEANERRG
jgi:hypothetical protein